MKMSIKSGQVHDYKSGRNKKHRKILFNLIASEWETTMKHQKALEKVTRNGGEVGELMRKLDWSKTGIGTIDKWPKTFHTTMSICLTSRFPIVLYLGPEFTMFYNDAYISFLGRTKHPAVLGRPAQEGWSEIWETIGPTLKQVMIVGEASWSEDILMFFDRGVPKEEVYVTFSFSPVFNKQATKVDGIFCACTETTEKIVGNRRLETLRQLGVFAAEVHRVGEVYQKSMKILATNPYDIPFAAIYFLNEDSQAILGASFGVSDYNLFPPSLAITEDKTSSSWPLATALHNQCSVEVTELYGHSLALPGGPWPEPAKKAAVVPIFGTTHNSIIGFLIAGISPRRIFNTQYRSFFDLVAGHLSTTIQNAKAYEDEKKRAELLEEINRAKTVFFNNISHEFRTPLTLMLGPLEDSLSDITTPLMPTQRARQLLIYNNATRLLKLVNSLLDFSRIEAKRMQAVYEPTNLAEITAHLASAFRTTIEKAGLRFSVNMSPIDEPVYVDKEMWEKVIFNLLSNAFKFTFNGEIKISLQKQGNFVELIVQDTGVGIPEQALPRLFERFHRVESTKGRSYEGSGIGLALVQELIKLHGGTIDVKSKDNEGSSFIIKIPLGFSHLPAEHIGKKRESYKPAAIGQAYVSEASSWLTTSVSKVSLSLKEVGSEPLLSCSETAIGTTKKAAKILVVDDNADMRQYLTTLLSSFWQVEAVTHGEEAYQAVLKQPFNLILSDVMMPVMNGFELIKKIRAEDSIKLIPIILLSARAGEEARIEGLNAGADDYLVKPFSAKELLARVNTQLELGYLRVQLEEQVKQRTHELQMTNEALRVEMKERVQIERRLAEQNLQVKLSQEYHQKQTEFLNTICHEIRNPLNGIYGAIILLRDKLVAIEAQYTQQNEQEFNEMLVQMKEDVSVLEQCAQQQKFIVDDVLDLSKLESDKLVLNPVPFGLKETFNNFTRMFRSQLQQKNLNLLVNLPADEIWLMVDTHRLSQIMTNLLSNAIKFTAENGQIFITVFYEPLINNEGRLNVILKDTGIGMTPEEIARLFNPFVQASHQTASQYGGSGLGLAICKKLVEKMGGAIDVKSQKGQGTQFSFTVSCQRVLKEVQDQPQALGENLLLKKRSSDQSGEPSAATSSTSKHILIVEDNVINQKLLRHFLEQRNYMCQVANNGLEAIEKYQQFHFNLIFMDIEMPLMGGLEATQRIRQLEKEKASIQTPIIIVGLSGNTSKEQIEIAIQSGMDAYLTKPVLREEVYRIIDELTSADSLLLKKQKLDVRDTPNPSRPPAIKTTTPVSSLFFNAPITFSLKQLIKQSTRKISERSGLPIVSIIFTDYKLVHQLQQTLKEIGIGNSGMPGQARKINVIPPPPSSNANETYSIDLSEAEYDGIMSEGSFAKLISSQPSNKDISNDEDTGHRVKSLSSMD